MNIRKLSILVMTFTFSLATLSMLFAPQKANAAFNPNVLIDDVVFNASSSMGAAQIDAFLNGFPNSCISSNSGFRSVVPAGYTPSGGFIYGDFTTAGNVIATAAQVYGINPQVLIATLQKEQSLVSGGVGYCENGSYHKYAAAMGYGCPDGGSSYSYSGIYVYMRNGVVRTSTGGTCVESVQQAGFSQQIIRAAWRLKFNQQRSLGNTTWAVITGTWDNSDDPGIYYAGPMTKGTHSRISSQSPTYFDGLYTIDNTTVSIDTGGTAALYYYTPHFHGNQNFVSIFESWFGGTISSAYYSCRNTTNVSGVGNGHRIMANRFGGSADTLSLIQLNNTGSKCVEVHTWLGGSNYQQWVSHTATNRNVDSPNDTEVISANLSGDSRDELVKIEYRNTGSGKIEIHVWSSSYQQWISHTATNRSAIDPADAEIVAADGNGDGRDELYLVQYRNTGSGKIEIHGWSGNFQQWISHTATNRSAIDPANAGIVMADTNGDGRDETHLVEYRSTGSNKIEVHSWGPTLKYWLRHTASNRTAVNPGTLDSKLAEVITADTNGDNRDEFLLVQYSSTGSNKIEIHGWTSDLQYWVSHTATNQTAY